MNEITDASRRQAIADILDYRERRRADSGERQPLPAVVSDARAIAAILDHHEARRAAGSTAPAVGACEPRVYGEGPAPLALLLDSRIGAR